MNLSEMNIINTRGNFVTKRFRKDGKTYYEVQKPSGNIVLIQGMKNLMKWMEGNK